jgi:DNA-binding SARP family transcriptional activator/tetratricopeptide (TPR) repeat protein
VEFRILGPLEVVADGRSLELGGQQQRALLVSLLLEANTVVSSDRLIHILWGAQPPATAQKALQVHISNLRKLLGRERVETTAPGYLLRLDPSELDLSRFEQLWADGRPADALDLWRGPPLPEFAYHDFAQVEIGRLAERRLLCLEERIDAELAAGRHEAIASELEALVREHPLREGLRSRLMLALYRSARQAEALQAYQDARAVLVEELGIEPGRALRDLQHRILEQDSALDLEKPLEEAPAVDGSEEGDDTAADVRKTVTVLTAKVAVGQLDPEVERRLTGDAFAAIEAAVASHGGTVETVFGDGITAVFGLPAVHEDDALRAVRAGADLSALRGTEIRIGVSTGRIVAGGARPASGEPLTSAARLADAAGAGEVRFDESTWRRVRDAVAGEQLDGSWVLTDLSAAGVRAERLVSPMVGRERERRRLHDTFVQATGDHSCQLFTILGPAGVGKSRLLQEFLEDLGAQAVVARGRCLPYGEGITFWPLLEAIKDAVELDDADPREMARAKLSRVVEGDDAAAATVERVARMIGLAEGETRVDEGFAAVRALFAALARDRPLVAVFDDIHWAESTFLDLVEDVVDWSRDAPILVVCLARPELLEQRPGWGGGKVNTTTALLEPLSGDECRSLIENLLGDARLPGDVALKIVEGADGNPLFVEEMLFMLIEDSVLVRRDGRWNVDGALDSIRVPPTIEALLATRLDQLDRVERAVIERAAVGGKVFYESAVLELMPEPLRPHVETATRSLVRKELIRPERGTFGGRNFRFRHLLIRDAAYDSISKHSRADLHQRFGAWLEQTGRDTATEYEEVIGYHLEQATLCLVELGARDEATPVAREAARRLGNAGRRAFALSDLNAGLNLVSRAVALLAPDDPLRVELVPNVRAVQALNRDLSWADRVLTEAIEAAATSGDRLLAARALVQRGFVRLFSDPAVTADELLDGAERAIAVFDEFRDELGLGRAWRLKAQAYYLGRRGAACAAASERALEHVRCVGDTFEEREIIEWLAIALILGPVPVEDAIARCSRLLDETRADRLLHAELLGTTAALVTMARGPDDAQELADSSWAIMDELGTHIWLVAFWRSFVSMARGDPVTAESELRPAYDALKHLGETSHFSTVTHALGSALYLQGRLDEAEQMTRECEAASQPNDVHSNVLWRAVRAKVFARKGELHEARRLAEAAVAIAAASDFLLAHGHASLALAEVLERSGEPEAAAAAGAEADRLFELKGVRFRPEAG